MVISLIKHIQFNMAVNVLHFNGFCCVQEREKYNKMVEKMQRDVAEAQQNVYEENLARQRLQMEMDSKDSEIEQLRQKLSMFNVDSASVNSGSLEDSVVDEPTSGEFRARQREGAKKTTKKTSCSIQS